MLFVGGVRRGSKLGGTRCSGVVGLFLGWRAIVDMPCRVVRGCRRLSRESAVEGTRDGRLLLVAAAVRDCTTRLAEAAGVGMRDVLGLGVILNG